MSAPKHTPGPWKFWLNNNGTFTLFGNGGDQVILCGAGLINRDHNVRLIAAAPELLEMLEQVVAWMDAPNESAFSDGQLSAARAAIAKAKGEA